jgi:hypothetical protein
LREAADLLEQQQANPFRVRAYRRAADTVDNLKEDLGDIAGEGGRDGLTRLPAIGPSIAAGILEMLRTGRWSHLDRMRGSLDPEGLFRSIPGVGEKMARRIHETLGVDSLQDLEIAAHDGRLGDVEGIGPRRAAMIRGALTEMLGRRPPRLRPHPENEPSIAALLDVDEEYRSKGKAGALPTIAPRRFNPSGEPWLPILHTQRDGWDFTALFSNTARAHDLGRTRDWVVIYFHDDKEGEGQRTVVTEHGGELAGRRVVRGRDAECRAHYNSAAAGTG